MSCQNNTMIMGRPTGDQCATAQCGSTCSSGDQNDPLWRPGLGPRKKRDKVREQLREYILNMLGAPAVTLELDEQNIDFCIRQALMIVETYAPREYFTYYTFYTNPGQSVYKLPPEVGFVSSVEYKNTGTFSFQASDMDGAIPVEYFYPGGSHASIQGGLIDPIQPIWGRMGEWVLYKQYERMYTRISSGLGGWEWIGGFGHIKVYPVPAHVSLVIVHYIQRMKDWEEVTQAMQEGALSYAKEILGRIRGKMKNPAGPNGGVQMDGDALIAEAKEERKEWKEDLIMRFGEAGMMGIMMG